MAKLAELYTELTAKDAGLASKLGEVRKTLDAVQSGLDSFARKGAAAFAVLSAGLGFAVKEAMDAEDAMIRLRGALAMQGEEGMAGGLEAFASQLQQITIYGDDALKAVMGLGLNMGVSASNIRQVTRDAIGLAQAIGVDLNTGMRYAALASQGEYDALSRLVPALRSANTEAEKAQILQRMMASGFTQATDAANTTGGALKQLWNAVTDLAEAIGVPLLGHVKGFVIWAKQLVKELTDWISKHGELIVTIGKVVIALGVMVAAAMAVSKAMAIAQALSGPKGWAALAVGVAAAAGEVYLVDKAFDGLQGSIQQALLEQQKLTEEMKRTAGEAARIPAPWSSKGGASNRQWGQRDPRVVEGVSPGGRGGSFVGIAELAKSMQQAAWDAERRRLEQEQAASAKKREQLLQQIKDKMGEGGAGLAIVPG